VSGPVPLTPIQRWFLDQEPEAPSHYNQAFLLAVDRELDPDRLERALAAVALHHDALRLRVRRTPDGWTQEIAGVAEPLRLLRVDLGEVADGERAAAIAREASAIQAGLDIERGPIATAALLTTASGARRLLLAVHHLAVDAVSWRVLLEDLASAYEQLGRGEPIRLPAKTTSFKAWAERLAGHARSAAASEANHWLSEVDGPLAFLPRDSEGGENRAGTVRTFSVSLGPDDTTKLLRDVVLPREGDATAVLLAALACALGPSAGGALLVDVEAHGREPLADDVDVTRTVGWFTSLFPFRLDGGPRRRALDVLDAVREGWQRVPGRGRGYGLLRHLDGGPVGDRLRRSGPAPVSFNYLGRIDESFQGSGLFRLATESAGAWRSPLMKRPHLLEVMAVVAGGALHVTWHYGAEVHRQPTIERWALALLSALRELIPSRPSDRAGWLEPAAAAELGSALGEVEFE
jgi:non-ribosomal peptide synthase protein (TIGR01720 family)